MPVSYRTPAFYILALFITDFGASVPWGLQSGGTNKAVAVEEWVLCILFLVAALALLVRLFGFIKQPVDAYAIAFSAALWTITALDAAFFLDGVTWRYRLGVSLVCAGIATACAFTYAVEVIAWTQASGPKSSQPSEE